MAIDRNDLALDAVKINGVYIEDLISDFATLKSEGRETNTKDIVTKSYKFNGSVKDYTRYPEKEIKITYVMGNNKPEALKADYIQLLRHLNVEDAEIIFNDEPDKFYIGSISVSAPSTKYANVASGTYTIVCADPFKYSVNEYEVAPSVDEGSTFAIDYNGTAPAYPSLECSFGDVATSCGYVGYMDDEANVIQLGDPTEVDKVLENKSEQLIYSKFTTSAEIAKWTANNGHALNSAYHQLGSFTNGTCQGETGLIASDHGTYNGWHGPTLTRAIPADSNGVVGATNWTFNIRQKIGKSSAASRYRAEGGHIQFFITDGTTTSNCIAGVDICIDQPTLKASVELYVNGSRKKSISYPIDAYNKYWGYSSSKNKPKCSSFITKTGSKIIFNIAGLNYTFVDDSIANVLAKSITIGSYKYKTYRAMPINAIFQVSFSKNNVASWNDIPNKFNTGDVLVANCEDGTIKLNGTPRADLGAIGNDWEQFTLHNGTNQIGIVYSDFTTVAPTFKLKYREVFI